MTAYNAKSVIMSINGEHPINQAPQKTKQSIKKPLKECWPYILKMNDYQLKQVIIAADGEFFKCPTSKDSLDIVNHLKVALRDRGFGCYALHNYIWIVPFIHTSVHLPDFERAKSVLPDLKSEIINGISPEIIEERSHAKKHRKEMLANSFLTIFDVIISAFSFLVVRLSKAR